ncbi:MAG: nucleotidyltransferase family protein [Cellulosilyticaceae bacterium]
MKKINVEQEIINSIRMIATHFETIECIKLFGSRVRGDNSQTSDIDLSVFGNTIDQGEFAYQIEMQVATLLEFDISYMSEIEDRAFMQQVEQEGVIIYEKPRV